MVDYSLALDPKTASAGLLHLLNYLYDTPNKGTGVANIIIVGENLLGPHLPPALISYVIGIQNNLFGSYPTRTDIAPSIVFAVVFGVLLLFHLLIFIINTSRGHYFWISLAWIVYCIFRVIGFSLQASWATDVTVLAKGLTAEVFNIVASMIIVTFNLMLTQRLFTWRHPVGGSRKLFWFFMLALYAIVLVIIAITIMASFIPYLYYLSTPAYVAWQRVVMASVVLIILYSLTSVALLALSYWAPTSKDERLYTFQPWWIESFSTFYFVKKNAAQEAEATFMKRNSNHRHAIRVIAATHHHYKMVEGLSNERGDLKHNISMGLIIFSTLAILMGALFRAVIVFQGRLHRNAISLEKPVVMYICWGLLEFIVNVLYIVFRVDLRFYRPDILPAAVRAIITAQQSRLQSRLQSQVQTAYASDNEDEGSFIEFDDDYTDNELNFDNDQNTFRSSSTMSEPDHKHPYLSHSSDSDSGNLPYPSEKYHEKSYRDDESDFNF